jgi:diguanylate cyclase (GGDEF)-like protein
MGYRGRVISICLILCIHTAIGTYVAISDGKINMVTIWGYPIWFFLGYWIGKKYDQVAFYSEKDPLTNLYNRRYVLRVFNKITYLANRRKMKCVVMMIDCDHFKAINDRYNHHVGDLVLSRIGEILLGNSKKYRLSSRWGGDEFLVIDLLNHEESLENMVAEMNNVFSSQLINKELQVSVSIGVALYPDHHTDLAELIKIADKSMYANKESKNVPKMDFIYCNSNSEGQQP